MTVRYVTQKVWVDTGLWEKELSSFTSLGVFLPIQSSAAKVTLERHVLAGADAGRVLGGSLFSLGACVQHS